MGKVKLADFGLSVKINKGEKDSFKNPVCTLLYQSPEQLLHVDTGYSYKADIWSLGCVIVELLLGQPLFSKARNHSHLTAIMLSSIDREKMKGWSEGINRCNSLNLTHYIQRDGLLLIDFIKKKCLFEDNTLIDLIDKMLCPDPSLRISASQILEHSFLKNIGADTNFMLSN